VILEIFSREEQVMGLLLPDSGSPQLLGFDDRTVMYEGDAKTGRPRGTGMASNCAAEPPSN
jgi:hypothetical protein